MEKFIEYEIPDQISFYDMFSKYHDKLIVIGTNKNSHDVYVIGHIEDYFELYRHPDLEKQIAAALRTYDDMFFVKCEYEPAVGGILGLADRDYFANMEQLGINLEVFCKRDFNMYRELLAAVGIKKTLKVVFVYNEEEGDYEFIGFTPETIDIDNLPEGVYVCSPRAAIDKAMVKYCRSRDYDTPEHPLTKEEITEYWKRYVNQCMVAFDDMEKREAMGVSTLSSVGLDGTIKRYFRLDPIGKQKARDFLEEHVDKPKPKAKEDVKDSRPFDEFDFKSDIVAQGGGLTFAKKQEASKNKGIQILRSELGRFIEQTSFQKFFEGLREFIQGQDDELKKAAYNVYMYIKAAAKGEVSNYNFILTAPSGCGKTQFFRAVESILNKQSGISIPVLQIDMSSITEEGFKGGDTTEIIDRILKANPYCDGTAIVFMDEFDKKIQPSYTAMGTDANEGVQSQLLTMLEGCVKSGSDLFDEGTIDTKNTLFVGLGAFQSIREEKNFSRNKTVLGFTNEKSQEKVDYTYEYITKDDIRSLGCKDELAGRFTQIINFHRLNREAIHKIARGYIDKYSKQIDCDIECTEAFLDELEEFANGPMGCRNMESKLYEILQPKLIELEELKETESKESESKNPKIVIESIDNIQIISR